MREILYKALSMCRGERWVYGQPRHYARNPRTEKWTMYDPTTGIETDIYEETICQCTGIKDGKGDMIFENDIIQEDYPKVQYKVFWDDSMLQFAYKNIAFKQSYPLAMNEKRASYFTIIGNCFDNI